MYKRLEAMKIGKLKHILLAEVLLSIPAIAFAQNSCAWLNKPTAAGILDTPAVNLKVQSTPDGGGSCLFQAQESAAVNLSITVYEMKDAKEYKTFYQSHCGSPVESLRAIGNEAEVCSARSGPARKEQVVGRVRNAAFIVSINTAANSNSVAGKKLLQEKLENIAEQVAGSLF